MAALTLTDARSLVIDLVDDDNTRWATAEVDRALTLALGRTLSEYASTGGHRLTEEVSVNTSSGDADLSTYDPRRVISVVLVSGDYYQPLQAVERMARGPVDTTVHALRIHIMRNLSLPTTTTHPIVGNGATAFPAFPEFEQLVCYRAAQQLLIKDKEINEALDLQEQRLARDVMTEKKIASVVGFRKQTADSWVGPLQWIWNANTKKITIVHAPETWNRRYVA
jgi:hypothetical protein